MKHLASHFVDHALVTDPKIGRSSGYSVVAASGGLHEQELDFLETHPLITSHLHREGSARSHFALCRAPTGRWIFGRRWTSGERRGSYHRIVHHALVFEDDLLEAVAHEPQLLAARAHFALDDRSTDPASWADLATALLAEREERWKVNEGASHRWAALRVELPRDPRADALRFYEGRAKMVADRLGAERGERFLAATLELLRRGRRALLAAEDGADPLVALVWASLPPADRRSVAWASHIAEGAGGVYQLATSPNARETLHRLAAHEEWDWVDGEEWSEESRSVARFLLRRRDLYASFRLHASADDLRWVGTDGVGLAGLVAWLESGGEETIRGFGTLEELSEYLRKHRKKEKRPARGDGQAEPFRETRAYQSIASAETLLRMDDCTPLQAAEAVLGAIRGQGLVDQLVFPHRLEAVARTVDRAPSGAMAFVGALSIWLSSLAGYSGKGETFDRLWECSEAVSEDLVRNPPRDDFARRVLVQTWLDFTFAMARSGSRRFHEAVDLGREMVGEFGSGAEIRWPLPEERTRDVSLAVFRLLREQDPRVAAEVAAEELVPELVGSKTWAESLERGFLKEIVGSLSERPDAAADLLLRGSFVLAATVRVAFQDWGRERAGSLYRVADAVVQRSGYFERLASLQVLPGAAGILADAGAPFRLWYPFALAEALQADDPSRGGQEESDHVRGLDASLQRAAEGGALGDESDAVETLSVWRRGLSLVNKRRAVGPRFRVATGVIRDILAGDRKACLDLLATIRVHASADEYLRWGDLLGEMARMQREEGYRAEASVLARKWWDGWLRTVSDASVVRAETRLLEPLTRDGRASVARRIAHQARYVGDRDRQAITDFVYQVAGEDRELVDRIEVELLEQQIRAGEFDLVEGFRQLLARKPHLPPIGQKELASRLVRTAPSRLEALASVGVAEGLPAVVSRWARRELVREMEGRGRSCIPDLPLDARFWELGATFQHRAISVLVRSWRDHRAELERLLREACYDGRQDIVRAALHRLAKRGELRSWLRRSSRDLVSELAREANGLQAPLVSRGIRRRVYWTRRI